MANLQVHPSPVKYYSYPYNRGKMQKFFGSALLRGIR